MTVKQFPSGNWDVGGVFVQKKGTFQESVKRQLRIIQSRDKYISEDGNKRTIMELKKILKELK